MNAVWCVHSLLLTVCLCLVHVCLSAAEEQVLALSLMYRAVDRSSARYRQTGAAPPYVGAFDT